MRSKRKKGKLKPTHPEGQRGAIFGKLEAHKAINQNAAICSGDDACVDGRKPLQRRQR